MDMDFLAQTALFQGMAPEDIQAVLGCVGAYERSYPRDSLILRAGDPTALMGLVLEGSVNIRANSYWGDTTILGHVGRRMLFAEAYAAVPDRELLCDAVAAQDCRVLFLRMDRLLTSCQNSCSFHNRLIHNMIRILASKSLGLSARVLHITPRTIRQRLLAYLSDQEKEHASPHFTIPYSRQQLADYLSVDRTALSNELSKMQKEGLLTYRKNTFTLSEMLE